MKISTLKLTDSLNPESLLAIAIEARHNRNFDDAISFLTIGFKMYPAYLDHYGQDAFIKELLRTLLMTQRWSEAHSVINQKDFDRNDHWYEILFARAYEAAGSKEDALKWWTHTAELCPANWYETKSFFQKIGQPMPRPRMGNSRDLMIRDLNIAKRFVEHGANRTVATVDRFFQKSASASKEKAVNSLIQLIERAKNSITSQDAVGKGSIPKITHRIWLTDINNPKEPPSSYIERYLANLQEKFHPEWQHFFWVQSENLIPSTAELIKKSGLKIIIKNLDIQTAGPLPFELMNKFIAHRKFAFAADVAKIMCLFRHGGVYCDLGVIFNESIEESIIRFDYAFHLWHALLFQLSFIAMPPNSALARSYLSLITNPSIFPRYVVEHPLTGNADLSLVSGSAITILFFLLFPTTTNACLFISNRSMISHTAQQSWYTTPKNSSSNLGGVITAAETPTLASEDIWKNLEEAFFSIMI